MRGGLLPNLLLMGSHDSAAGVRQEMRRRKAGRGAGQKEKALSQSPKKNESNQSCPRTLIVHELPW